MLYGVLETSSENNTLIKENVSNWPIATLILSSCLFILFW